MPVLTIHIYCLLPLAKELDWQTRKFNARQVCQSSKFAKPRCQSLASRVAFRALTLTTLRGIVLEVRQA